MILNGSKIFILSIGLLFLTSCKDNQQPSKPLSCAIIPKPNQLILKDSYCYFNSLNFINNENTNQEITTFKFLLKDCLQPNKEIFKNDGLPILILQKKKGFDQKGDYSLIIKSDSIIISSFNNKGTFYGLQTLFQLIALNNENENFFLPCLEINDGNFFQHRGFLLDCCRHFFDIKTIKKYIDLLSIYKMNVFHWHLTEDQGWRIEIDKYPLLNSVGSWRNDSLGKYGGYYTKKQIKEIVEYAKKRHIKVIPEIELPGHSQAAIASYPNLSCKQKPIKVANDWGVFKEIYCAGNDSVFIFIEDVLNEVVELFPSNLVHIGGDEAPKFRWENCPKCQKRIKNEGLKDEHELQSYFIERIANILASKNKTIIGWDEILESEIKTDAIVQSWRGFEGGIKAVKSGKKAIMSPTSNAYFDYKISTTDLEKVYDFNPIPAGLNQHEQNLIIGGECNLWSERILDEIGLDYKAFPRLLAMSEVLWTSPKDKNYNLFKENVQEHYSILEKLNVKYGPESVPVEITLIRDNNNFKANISSKVDGLKFKYKWQDSKYKNVDSSNVISVEKSGKLHVQAFKNKNMYGHEKSQSFSIHLANYKKVKYNSNYNKSYKSKGDISLVDGTLGSIDFTDGNWQGFWGNDLNCEIDLDKTQNINSVNINFYQYSNSWILIPESIEIYFSNDKLKWIKAKEHNNISKPNKRGKFIENISFNHLDLNTRYIKVVAKNFGELPSWHEAAGSKSWLFVDEITVQ